MNEIAEFFTDLFGIQDFPARWVCGRWTSFHGWLYIISDLAIFAAYFTIPFLLIKFIYRKKDLPFLPVFWLFVAFILFCGITHLIDALSFWWPAYRLNGLMRLFTASVSWFTVFGLAGALPKALSLKGPDEMRQIIEDKTDKLRTANEEIRNFTYSVSHDLRTPLNSVMMGSHMLKEDYGDKLDEEGKQLLEVLHNSSTKMSMIINGLIEFSQLGGTVANKERLSMYRLFKGELDEQLVNQPSPKHKIKLADDIPSAYGDSTLIKRVASNLIANALKYSSKEKNPEVEIGSFKKGGEIVYYVKDNGVGLDDNDSERIFGIFTRLHPATEFEGTGIGLAVVKRIVEEQHGGRVWVKSKPGKGATFYFILPHQS